jgi:hypothetical protein
MHGLQWDYCFPRSPHGEGSIQRRIITDICCLVTRNCIILNHGTWTNSVPFHCRHLYQQRETWCPTKRPTWTNILDKEITCFGLKTVHWLVSLWLSRSLSLDQELRPINDLFRSDDFIRSVVSLMIVHVFFFFFFFWINLTGFPCFSSVVRQMPGYKWKGHGLPTPDHEGLQPK